MDKFTIDQEIVIALPLTTAQVTDSNPAVTVNWRVFVVEPTAGNPIVNQTFNPTVNISGEVSFPLILTERSVCRLEYDLVTGTDTFTYSIYFIAEPVDNLTIATNSYQSYYGAILNAEDLHGIDSFKNATKEEQCAALSHAYKVLNTMTYSDGYKDYYNLGSLTQVEMEALTAPFLQALRFAQVIEANEMLDGNSLFQKRQEGVMSETIGESSMMFRPGNILNYPITRRSMMFLRNYIVLRARLERA
jgi:hypothetical protein